MAYHMAIQTVAGGSYSLVDIVGLRLANFKYKAAYEHPAMLEFTATQPQQSFPLGIRSFIVFWDDAGFDPDGAPLSSTNPIFEGYIWTVEPAGSQLVKMVAYDPSHMAGRSISVMSAAYQAYTPGVMPDPGIGTLPRLLFNCLIDNDEDYAFARLNYATIGDMLQVLFDDCLPMLQYWNAAPQDGSAAYYAADLALMTMYAQEKEVIESDTFSGAIRQLMTYLPDLKLVFIPGVRKWKFIDPTISTARTFTLNQSSGSNQVLHLDLHRSIDKRYSAVGIYGAETTTIGVFRESEGALTPFDAGVVAQTYSDATGIHDARVYSSYQIVDPTFRRGARLLPIAQYASMPTLVYDASNPGLGQLILTRSPFLEVSFDGGTTWSSVLGVQFDFQRGIASTGDYLYWQTNHSPPASTQTIFPPTDVRLVWAYYVSPLKVRWPLTGFDGTSFAVANIQDELRIVEPNFVVGYEYGTAVTTAAREAQELLFAQRLHAQRKDIAYMGVAVLEGVQNDFMRLQRLVNLAAIDGDGNAITTGWEAAGMIATDVEHDFEKKLTTLMFSSDKMQVVGMSPEAIKKRLGIRPLIRLEDDWLRYDLKVFGNSFAWVQRDIRYIDPVVMPIPHGLLGGPQR